MQQHPPPPPNTPSEIDTITHHTASSSATSSAAPRQLFIGFPPLRDAVDGDSTTPSNPSNRCRSDHQHKSPSAVWAKAIGDLVPYLTQRELAAPFEMLLASEEGSGESQASRCPNLSTSWLELKQARVTSLIPSDVSSPSDTERSGEDSVARKMLAAVTSAFPWRRPGVQQTEALRVPTRRRGAASDALMEILIESVKRKDSQSITTFFGELQVIVKFIVTVKRELDHEFSILAPIAISILKGLCMILQVAKQPDIEATNVVPLVVSLMRHLARLLPHPRSSNRLHFIQGDLHDGRRASTSLRLHSNHRQNPQGFQARTNGGNALKGTSPNSNQMPEVQPDSDVVNWLASFSRTLVHLVTAKPDELAPFLFEGNDASDGAKDGLKEVPIICQLLAPLLTHADSMIRTHTQAAVLSLLGSVSMTYGVEFLKTWFFLQTIEETLCIYARRLDYHTAARRKSNCTCFQQEIEEASLRLPPAKPKPFCQACVPFVREMLRTLEDLEDYLGFLKDLTRCAPVGAVAQELVYCTVVENFLLPICMRSIATTISEVQESYAKSGLVGVSGATAPLDPAAARQIIEAVMHTLGFPIMGIWCLVMMAPALPAYLLPHVFGNRILSSLHELIKHDGDLNQNAANNNATPASRMRGHAIRDYERSGDQRDRSKPRFIKSGRSCEAVPEETVQEDDSCGSSRNPDDIAINGGSVVTFRPSRYQAAAEETEIVLGATPVARKGSFYEGTVGLGAESAIDPAHMFSPEPKQQFREGSPFAKDTSECCCCRDGNDWPPDEWFSRKQDHEDIKAVLEKLRIDSAMAMQDCGIRTEHTVHLVTNPIRLTKIAAWITRLGFPVDRVDLQINFNEHATLWDIHNITTHFVHSDHSFSPIFLSILRLTPLRWAEGESAPHTPDEASRHRAAKMYSRRLMRVTGRHIHTYLSSPGKPLSRLRQVVGVNSGSSKCWNRSIDREDVDELELYWALWATLFTVDRLTSWECYFLHEIFQRIAIYETFMNDEVKDRQSQILQFWKEELKQFGVSRECANEALVNNGGDVPIDLLDIALSWQGTESHTVHEALDSIRCRRWLDDFRLVGNHSRQNEAVMSTLVLQVFARNFEYITAALDGIYHPITRVPIDRPKGVVRAQGLMCFDRVIAHGTHTHRPFSRLYVIVQAVCIIDAQRLAMGEEHSTAVLPRILEVFNSFRVEPLEAGFSMEIASPEDSEEEWLVSPEEFYGSLSPDRTLIPLPLPVRAPERSAHEFRPRLLTASGPFLMNNNSTSRAPSSLRTASTMEGCPAARGGSLPPSSKPETPQTAPKAPSAPVSPSISSSPAQLSACAAATRAPTPPAEVDGAPVVNLPSMRTEVTTRTVETSSVTRADRPTNINPKIPRVPQSVDRAQDSPQSGVFYKSTGDGGGNSPQVPIRNQYGVDSARRRSTLFRPIPCQVAPNKSLLSLNSPVLYVTICDGLFLIVEPGQQRLGHGIVRYCVPLLDTLPSPRGLLAIEIIKLRAPLLDESVSKRRTPVYPMRVFRIRFDQVEYCDCCWYLFLAKLSELSEDLMHQILQCFSD